MHAVERRAAPATMRAASLTELGPPQAIRIGRPPVPQVGATGAAATAHLRVEQGVRGRIVVAARTGP